MELLNIQFGHQRHNIGQHGEMHAPTIKIAVTDQEDQTSTVPISSGMSWKVMTVHSEQVPPAMHGVRIDAPTATMAGPYRTPTMAAPSSVTTLNCGARAMKVASIRSGAQWVQQQLLLLPLPLEIPRHQMLLWILLT